MKGKAAQPSGLFQSAWPWILCLIGVDYFSSLAYQPSIAFETAGYLAPFATLVVVLLTFLGALPVYAYVAGRSPHGQGAIGLLERLIAGWFGKLLIVILLGFAATDFVITRTLSVADAAEHLIHNPQPAWQHTLSFLGSPEQTAAHLLPPTLGERVRAYWNKQLVVTVLLSIIGFIFWAFFRRGFTRKVIKFSAAIAAVYLAMTAYIVGSGLVYLGTHPEILSAWWSHLSQGHWHPDARFVAPGGWFAMAALCFMSFPKMALGLSGFELSMVVMPLVKGRADDLPADLRSRVRHVRQLLYTVAAIMAPYLLGSALVTTTLIPPEAFASSEKAANRALAYLAHGGLLSDGNQATALNTNFGSVFGTLYDLITIIILCLAGASVAIGLRDFVPHYLHRLGMELDWALKAGGILYIFNAVNLLVTVIFRASVTAQRNAYAASVLMLLSGATAVAVIDVYRRRSGHWHQRLPWAFVVIGMIFFSSALAAVVSKPDGLVIAMGFVLAIVLSSILSRTLRSTELRFGGFDFKDSESHMLWDTLRYLEFPVLIPHRPGLETLSEKECAIRQRHRLGPDVPVVFVHAHLGDASDFYHQPLMEIRQEDGRFIIDVCRCASIAHVIAAIALELSKVGKPPEIHFGWSNERPFEANLNFLLFGQGNIPWMVRDLIRKAEPDPDRQPATIIG